MERAEVLGHLENLYLEMVFARKYRGSRAASNFSDEEQEAVAEAVKLLQGQRPLQASDMPDVEEDNG